MNLCNISHQEGRPQASLDSLKKFYSLKENKIQVDVEVTENGLFKVLTVMSKSLITIV